MQGSGITTPVPFSNKGRTKTNPKPGPDLIHMSRSRGSTELLMQAKAKCFELPVTPAAAHAIPQHTTMALTARLWEVAHLF